MNDVDRTTSALSTLSRVLTPLRISSIITILALVAFKPSWDFASIVYYGFFGIFFSSFFIEMIHYGKNRTKLVGLAFKYILILPFEFIGAFVFAITTLPFPNSQEVHELEIKVTIIVLGVSVIAELFHYVMYSKEKFQLDVKKILSIILMAVLSIYEAIFIHLFLLTSKSHS